MHTSPRCNVVLVLLFPKVHRKALSETKDVKSKRRFACLEAWRELLKILPLINAEQTVRSYYSQILKKYQSLLLTLFLMLNIQGCISFD